MVSKNTGRPARPSTGGKSSGRTSRKPKKPVTIDLKASPGTETKAEPEKQQKTSTPKIPTSPVPDVKQAAKPAAQPTKVEKPSQNGKGKSAASGKRGGDPKPSNKTADSGTVSDAPPVDAGSGFVGKMAAGIVGGVITLAGAYLLQLPGLFTSSSNSSFDAATAISTLQSEFDDKLAALGGKPTEPVDLAPLETRLAQLETSGKQAGENSAKFGSWQVRTTEELTKLEASVTRLEETTSTLQQSISSGNAGENAGLSALSARIDVLENSVSQSEEGAIAGLKDDLDAVKKELTTLSANVVANSQKPTIDYADRIAGLTAQLAAIEARSSGELSKINEKVAGLDGGINDTAARLDKIAPRIAAIEENISTPSEAEQRAARTLAITGLKTAIDSGGGFAEALALFNSLSDNKQDTAALKGFAEAGIPTVSAIKASFVPVAELILKAGKPEKNGSVAGRFLDSARSLVKVKSTGAVEGDGPQAVVSRIDAALLEGNLDKVLHEWDTLPEAAKAVSENWLKSVKARVQADALITNLLKQFIAGISGSGN